MILIEEESEQLVAGYDEREWIYKRFFWRDGGFFYVYQSSIPDEYYPDEEDGRDDATRYDVPYMTYCFKCIGKDLLME